MKVPLALMLAWRAFRARQSRLLLSSSFAMALGLVPLVVVLSIADGMIEGISSRTIETWLYDLQIWSAGSEPFPRQALESVSGLQGVWAEQRGFALAYGASGSRLGLSVRGVEPRWAQEDKGALRYLKADSGSLVMGEDSIWLGREAAARLGVGVGGTLKLLTTKSQGTLSLPRVTTVRVSAVVSVGYQELDRLWLFAPLSLTRTLLDEGENPVFWGLKSSLPLEKTPELLAEVRAAVGNGWQVSSWQTTGRSQFLNYQATRTLLAVIMVLVLIVAAVNVSTAMVTAVAERRRETAILKALGAGSGLVRRQFLLLGLGAGILGTLVGLGAGVALALAVNPLVAGVDALVSFLAAGSDFHLLSQAYYLETIPVKFDPTALAWAGLGSVTLAVLSSWIPANRAARERPLEVLRRA